MLVFGGFYDITKELNDMYLFDFENEAWIQIFQDDVGVKLQQSIKSPTSPLKYAKALEEPYMDVRNGQNRPVVSSMSQKKTNFNPV